MPEQLEFDLGVETMAINDYVCPECGVDLTNIDPKAHSLSHWPEYLDPARSGKEATKRKALLEKGGVTKAEYLKSHPEAI